MAAGAFSPEVRRLVRERAGGLCERCRRWAVEEVHHRCPRGSGGSRAIWMGQPSNAAALCARCHRWVESHREDAVVAGWLVPRGIADRFGPGWVPVTEVSGRSWLLGLDGSKQPLDNR
jgi:hypothetical protein